MTFNKTSKNNNQTSVSTINNFNNQQFTASNDTFSECSFVVVQNTLKVDLQKKLFDINCRCLKLLQKS